MIFLRQSIWSRNELDLGRQNIARVIINYRQSINKRAAQWFIPRKILQTIRAVLLLLSAELSAAKWLQNPSQFTYIIVFLIKIIIIYSVFKLN